VPKKGETRVRSHAEAESWVGARKADDLDDAFLDAIREFAGSEALGSAQPTLPPIGAQA
jgi:predicted transcriptional regulator